MKNRNFPLVILVIVLIIAFMAAVYVSGSLPSYNAFIDDAYLKIVSLFHKVKAAADYPHETDTITETVAPAVSVKIEEAVPETEVTETAAGDVYAFTDGGYTLSSEGKYRWRYESTWPFVTEPVIRNGTVITLTAEPAFMTFSYEDGTLISKEASRVYPGEKASVSGNEYTLTGRDNQEYKFTIEEDCSFTDMRSVTEEKEVNHFFSLFVPSENAAEFMLNKIRVWTADPERELPEMKLYTGHINLEGNGNFWAQQNSETDTYFYVYAPERQGVYQIGLADENGVWLQANAFVSVFGENGDVKQVSLDYVANKPQVKLHLAENEIYYIAAGWAKDMYEGSPSWLQIAESH